MTRITVRHAWPSDAPGYIRLMKAILREEPPVDTPYAAGEFDPAPDAMAARIAEYPQTGNSLFLVVLPENDDSALIAALTCRGGSLESDAHTAELGIYVAKDWRGLGVGGALMAETMRWAGAHPQIRRVSLDVLASNTRAIRLYERFGFIREGVRRCALIRDGRAEDVNLMAWLAPEFP